MQQYDEDSFDKVNGALNSPLEFTYLLPTLDSSTVALAAGHRAVCIFVNDVADAEVRHVTYSPCFSNC